jgi:hypothetical protein
MSSDKTKTETRSRTWHFSHTLYTSVKPDAARGLCPTSSIGPWDLIKRMLDELFRDGPQSVFYIHLRVSRAAFDHCVACGRSGTALPNLPFTGFIQASSAIRPNLLQAWLDAVWTPVGSKLCSAPQYRNEFMDPPDAAAFVYFLVRGNPALEKAGRKRRQPTAPQVKFAQRPFGACSVNLPSWNSIPAQHCEKIDHVLLACSARPHTPAVLTSDRVRRGRRPLWLPER